MHFFLSVLFFSFLFFFSFFFGGGGGKGEGRKRDCSRLLRMFDGDDFFESQC